MDDVKIKSTAQFICKNCGGPTTYSAEKNKMICDYCGSGFKVEEYDDNVGASNNNSWAELEGKVKAYGCSSCGAELISDDLSLVTQCPYCGNHSVLEYKFEGTLRPQYIIPFSITKEEAIERLKSDSEKKEMVKKSFKNENELESIVGMYVPFWNYSAEAYIDGQFIGNVKLSEDKEYLMASMPVKSKMVFDNISVDGSKKMKDNYMDSLEPYYFENKEAFSGAYMVGFLAEKFDVDDMSSRTRVENRMKHTAFVCISEKYDYYPKFFDTPLDELVPPYSALPPFMKSYITPDNPKVEFKYTKCEYIMVPVWLVSTMYKKKRYLFAVNGQTGSVAGNRPESKLRRLIYAILAIVATLLTGAISPFLGVLVAIIGFVLVTHTDNKTNEKDEASKNIVYSKCEFTALEDVILSNNTKFKNAKKAYDKERKMFAKMIKKRAK